MTRSAMRDNGNASTGTTKPPGLSTISLDKIPPEPVRWLVPGYVPLGKLALLAGDGGEGKSSLSLHIAAAVTTGRPAFGLDYDPISPSDVLLIGGEDDAADTVVPRLMVAGADCKRIRSLEPGSLFDLSHIGPLIDLLKNHPSIRLIVVDPANAFLPIGVNENYDAHLRSVLSPLAVVAAKYKVAILLIKHFNKSTEARAVHRIGGSVSWVNAVRTAFIVAPDPSDLNSKLLLPVKSNFPTKLGFAYSLNPIPASEARRLTDSCNHLSPADRNLLASQLMRPEFLGDTQATAEEVLATLAQNTRSTRIEECSAWLVRFLGDYSWPDSEIIEAALREGFTQDNVKHAKAKLKNAKPKLWIKPFEKGGAWFCWMGTNIPPNPIRPENQQKEAEKVSLGVVTHTLSETPYALPILPRLKPVKRRPEGKRADAWVARLRSSVGSVGSLGEGRLRYPRLGSLWASGMAASAVVQAIPQFWGCL